MTASAIAYPETIDNGRKKPLMLQSGPEPLQTEEEDQLFKDIIVRAILDETSVNNSQWFGRVKPNIGVKFPASKPHETPLEEELRIRICTFSTISRLITCLLRLEGG